MHKLTRPFRTVREENGDWLCQDFGSLARSPFRSTIWLSHAIRLVARRNQWNGPIKSFKDRFHWSAPVVSCSKRSDRTAESENGSRPSELFLPQDKVTPSLVLHLFHYHCHCSICCLFAWQRGLPQTFARWFVLFDSKMTLIFFFFNFCVFRLLFVLERNRERHLWIPSSQQWSIESDVNRWNINICIWSLLTRVQMF